MKLDFLICGSPNQGFFSQIAFFRLCLDALGGHYANARLVAVFGGQTDGNIPASWRKYYENIEVIWAPAIEGDDPYFRAQHDHRFEVMREDADLVFICDADIAPLAPFDSLLKELVIQPALAGTIAHYHFPTENTDMQPEEEWTVLAKATIGKDIEKPYRYALSPLNSSQRTPFYLNYGMVAATPELMARFYKRDLELRDAAAEHVGEYWSAQVSVALTCADLSLKTKVLPIRYNFPNDPVADQLYPDEMKNIIFVHYLRQTNFRRDKIFASRWHFNRFLKSSLSGSDEYFRSHVERVTGGEYPFPRGLLSKLW